MRTNQADHKSIGQRFWVLTKQCSGLSLNRQPCPPNGGGGFILQQSCDKRGGKDRGSKCGQIIGLNWVLHFPACLFMRNRVYYKAHKFYIIILRLRNTNKAEFFIFPAIQEGYFYLWVAWVEYFYVRTLYESTLMIYLRLQWMNLATYLGGEDVGVSPCVEAVPPQSSPTAEVRFIAAL